MTKYKYTGNTVSNIYIDTERYKVSKENPIINVKVKLTKEEQKRLGIEEV